ncbi:Fur family transcriptional regulator [Desulfocurvus vexinensis]|uniref:Fur family transcriptional regulator n=1 Tax=Desulfocurvus vexinensis TaxID=399548 RepID=UPI0004BA6B5C|nr:transcriptional repressor [Desulfocurvus vexinensis]
MSRAAQLLRAAGVRATRKRAQVLDAVLAAGRAVAPAELLERPELAALMDRATLYRTLDLLAGRGLVLRTLGPDRAFRYCAGGGAPLGGAHGHFYCLRCHAMRCLPQGALAVEQALPPGAAAGHVEIRVDGLCAACREAEAAPG